MQVTAFADGKEVISSGAIILSDDENKFSLSISELKYTFNFVNDSGSMRVALDIDSSKIGVYKLFNFDSSDAITYIVDGAATVDDRPIGLRLFFHNIGMGQSRTRLINYVIVAA